MARRQDMIARSITYSILRSDQQQKSVLARIPAFFYVYWLIFECVREDLFKALRGVWQVDEHEYRKSFGLDDKAAAKLSPMGTFRPLSHELQILILHRRHGLQRLDLLYHD